MDEAPTTGTVTPPQQDGSHRDSFEAFYVWEFPRLVALARGLATPLAAEDLAQEAMLVAYRRWTHVSELERPEFWVRRVCANLAASQFRRRLVEIRATSRIARKTQSEVLDDPSEEFWSAVRRLPRRQAQAAALRFIYDMTISDIAATLDCSQGTVKQHLSRARASLATALATTEEADS
ncbi:MAG TPA: sigma-70 family RNA polymerase sigma factor [Marmoricola sp.]|nr:sigma-70 family RNA polymerase sigma factor [Marmoricola sp.]